jgi:hypothetical protein
MKIGVKIGPKNWREALGQVEPECVELWFRLERKDEYGEMTDELRKRNIPFGIHFWASIDGKYEPNLAYEAESIADRSEGLIKETVDIASRINATYVNIHPGSFTLKLLDFEKMELTVVPGKEVGVEQGRISLLRRIMKLHEYAKSKNVLLLTETLPKNETSHWRDMTGRNNPQMSKNIPPEVLVDLGKQGTWVTNDFSHTASSIISDDRNVIWNYLWDMTNKLAPFTRLIHLNTVLPPFNGTDSHNGVLSEDFAANVFPTKDQVMQLLSLFINRDDVWLIPEPEIEKMVYNYQAIQEIVKTLQH